MRSTSVVQSLSCLLLLASCPDAPVRTREVVANELLVAEGNEFVESETVANSDWQPGEPEFYCARVDVPSHNCPDGFVCLSRSGWLFDGSLELSRGCYHRCSGHSFPCSDQQRCGTAWDPSHTLWAQICDPARRSPVEKRSP